jgi:hypothetical protein
MRLQKAWSAEAVRRNGQDVPSVHAAKSGTDQKMQTGSVSSD